MLLSERRGHDHLSLSFPLFSLLGLLDGAVGKVKAKMRPTRPILSFFIVVLS